MKKTVVYDLSRAEKHPHDPAKSRISPGSGVGETFSGGWPDSRPPDREIMIRAATIEAAAPINDAMIVESMS